MRAPVSTPRFSRDGRRIAFFQSQNSVAVIDADGRNKKVLSSGWSGVLGAPCWAREDEILFAASRGTTSFGIWAVKSSGKERRLAQVPGTWLELYDCLPDGRALVGHHVSTFVLMGRGPGESEERSYAYTSGRHLSALYLIEGLY